MNEQSISARSISNGLSGRGRNGSTLALTVAAALMLCLVGIGAVAMGNLFGGARELQSLTDSGTLNIGKQMAVTGVPLDLTAQTVTYQYADSWITGGVWGTPETTTVTLNTGIEGTNFFDLADSNGNITLANYNRVIAQTMLIGFNAQAEGTMPAAANAQTLFDAVQQSSSSLSARLLTTLSNPAVSAPIFNTVGFENSLRMLGVATTPTFENNQYGVSYTSPGDCTNVYFDSSILPAGVTMPSGSLSQVTGPNSLPYLTGYFDINTGPMTIQGSPVFPGQQPHLISLRDFQNNMTSPVTTGYVAPNSFGASCSAPATYTQAAVTDSSSSVVGVLTTQYPASIPGGYVVIDNFIATNTFANLLSELNVQDQANMLAAITQRLREIMPSRSSSQIQTFLNNLVIPADPSHPTYIYLYPDPTSPLYANWHQQIVQAGVPDGTPGQLFASSVKPPTFPNNPINPQFGMLPDGDTQKYQAQHLFKWTPACGFNNFLGAFTIP